MALQIKDQDHAKIKIHHFLINLLIIITKLIVMEARKKKIL